MMTKKDKRIIWLIALIMILIIALAMIIESKQKNKNFALSNMQEEAIIIEENLSIEDQENIILYLEENLSELSPEKEVLGGTFYITSIDFLDNNNLILEYEDGHIALKAELEFQYIDKENIVIIKFDIKE